MLNVHVSVTSALRAIRFIVGILARVFVRNSMCLKSIVNSFVIAYDETINGRDSALNLNHIVIITVEGVDYCCIILDISKFETIRS